MKKFMEPELEVLQFAAEDILNTSSNDQISSEADVSDDVVTFRSSDTVEFFDSPW